MQLYVRLRPDLPAGGPYANMNPGDGKPFGVIEFGDDAYVSVKTDDEARRIIAAAAATIAMRKMIGVPHEFEPSPAGSVVEFSHCVRCGMLGDAPDHAEPKPLVISDSTIAAAEFFARPGNTVADMLAAQAAAGDGGVLFPACADYDPMYKLHGCELTAHAADSPHRNLLGEEWLESLTLPCPAISGDELGSAEGCTLHSGHFPARHRAATGDEWTDAVYDASGPRKPAPVVRITEADVDKAMASQYGWCPATTGPDEDLDVTLYCDREAGHDGSHHAPGPDEGSEVAWGDEAADEDAPCMKVGCGHGYDAHSLDLESGDRLYCQRCECRRFLSARAMRDEPAQAVTA